jgi:2-polyprenyl-6-methoxyphenol hydroxylase-like FAD-dependent oxidoreductase
MPSDVLIVGAGPVGLTLGTELLRRGVSVRLVEWADRPHPHAKAIILWPRGLEALARIGAADELVERGHRLRAQNYHSGSRRLATTRFDKLSGTRHSYALSLPQEETEAVLRDRFRAAGGRIDFGVRFVGLREHDDEIEADLRIEAGTSVDTCRWLVGCDGAHSAVREAIGVPFTGSSYPQQFLLADGECETTLSHAEAHYFMTPSGVVVVVGLPNGLFRVFVSVPPDAAVDDPVSTVQSAASARCPEPLHLRGTPRTGEFRVHRRAADRFRAGRVLLAGDAAHVHSPAGGQGLNTGIEDASALAWRLAGVVAGDDDTACLDDWERERRHVAAGVVQDTDRQTRLWTMRGWRRGLRDVALHAAQWTGLLDRFVVPRQAQLTLRYPGPRRRAGRIRTGMRLPDVRQPDGTWLHDMVRSPRAALLLFADPADRHADAGRWSAVPGIDVTHVTSRQVRSALGSRTPTAAVVRPDGVVAWAGRPDDPRLGEWLGEHFGRVPATA